MLYYVIKTVYCNSAVIYILPVKRKNVETVLINFSRLINENIFQNWV